MLLIKRNPRDKIAAKNTDSRSESSSHLVIIHFLKARFINPRIIGVKGRHGCWFFWSLSSSLHQNDNFPNPKENVLAVLSPQLTLEKASAFLFSFLKSCWKPVQWAEQLPSRPSSPSTPWLSAPRWQVESEFRRARSPALIYPLLLAVMRQNW